MSRAHGSKQQQLHKLLQLITGPGHRCMAAAVALTLLLWVCFTNLYVVQPAHVIKASPALPPFKHSFHRMGPMGRSCSDHAASQAVDAAAATVLKPRSRDLPKSDAGAPVLVASNWDGAANRSHAELTSDQLRQACGYHLFRYRIVDGVVYADHDHRTNEVLKGHRDTFLEQLLTAVWLFKSFPSVDLWVSFADQPTACSLDVPVLQYTIFGRNVTRQAAQYNLAWESGTQISVGQLLTTSVEPEDPQAPAPKFYRGWGIGFPYSWEMLSLLQESLRVWQECLLYRVGGQPSIQKLIWRGSNTGGKGGWGPQVGPSVQPLRHPWGAALLNKRTALALLARSHASIMDVGLHDLQAGLMDAEGKDLQLVKALRELTVKPFVAQEQWGRYAAQLSIDGHGTPNRLPLQYLQGSSVILKVMSPYKDWFEERFEANKHYLPVKYDLSDIVPRTEELLGRFAAGDKQGMRDMATNAGAKAVEVFNILGQLDALAYAALKVKAVCDWEVVVPPLRSTAAAAAAAAQVPGVSSEPVWEVLKFERSRSDKGWKSPTLKASWADGIRASLLKELPENFVVTG